MFLVKEKEKKLSELYDVKVVVDTGIKSFIIYWIDELEKKKLESLLEGMLNIILELLKVIMMGNLKMKYFNNGQL